MTETFSFDKKKKLVNKIQQLTNKTNLIEIKNIILENNPNLVPTKNSNGYFLYFHNLTTDTYKKITDYLDNIEKLEHEKQMQQLDSEIRESSELLSENFSNEENNISKKLKLTNVESHILNRMRYEKELKKNETNSDEQIPYYNHDAKKYNNSETSNIFIQSKKKK